MATLDNKLVPLSGLKIAYDDISSKLETTYATKEDVSDKTASAAIVSSNLDANGSYTLPTGKLYNEVSVNLGKASVDKSSVTPSTAAQTVTINPGFLKEAASVTVNAIPNQKSKVVDSFDTISTAAAQTITIPAGYYTEASTVTLPKQNAVTITGDLSNNTVTPSSTTAKTVTVSKGWNAEADTITISKIGAGSHSGSVSTHTIKTTPVVTPSISGTITSIATTTKPSGTNGTDYFTIDPSGSVTTTGVSSAKAKAKIGTAGWISSDSGESAEHPINITPTVAGGTNYYIPATVYSKPSSSNNTEATGSAITPSTSAQVVAISAGYTPARKVTINKIDKTVLSDLTLSNLDSGFVASNIKKDVEIFGVKGTFTETSNGASGADIIKDKEAWVNGDKVTGSMPNAVIKSGSVTPKFTGPTYDSTAGNFTVSVSGTIAAPTVSTAGYISTDVGTKNTNSLSGSKTLNRIKLNTSSSGSLTYTPEISKGTKATDDTWVDAAKSAATKTKPTSGPHVKVSTAAKKGTLTITPKVATAGYGTTTDGQSEATPWSNTIGANASGDYYIPIKEITYGSVTTTAPNSTNYPDVFSGGITPSTSAKYVQIDAGYSFNRSIKIKAVPTETKTVTPSTSSQSVTPTTGKFLSKVTVNPASAMYQSVSIAKDDWNTSTKKCTKTVTGMTSSCSVMMRCTTDSGGLAGNGQVLCTAQATNSLTFTYSSSSKPSGTIVFDVVWYGY